jgi:hypothetical protein
MRYEALVAVNVKVTDFSGSFPKELLPTGRYYQENALTLAFLGFATSNAQAIPSFRD